MRDTRFIFVEGIMGSGKTTTAGFLTKYLHGKHIAAQFLAEGPLIEEPEHLLRVATALPHPNAAWLDVTIDEFITLSLQKWHTFAQHAQELPIVTICDGLLFHGNMTDLLLMNASPSVLRRYVTLVLDSIRVLNPILIYFYHPDIVRALRNICDERGSEWEAYQINWKITTSPYGRQHGLQGFDGFVQLYQEYRALCNEIFEQLAVPDLAIGNDGELGCLLPGYSEISWVAWGGMKNQGMSGSTPTTSSPPPRPLAATSRAAMAAK